MPEKIKKLLKNREIVMYVVFGVATTIVSFATYFAARWIFSGENTSPAVMISWVCAVTFAYITNSLWVFESSAETATGIVRELAKFYGSRLMTLGVELLLMFLLVDLNGISGGWYELCARGFVSVVVTVLNYFLSKIIVFRKKN